MTAPDVAVTPIMNALVAAATRIGTPLQVTSTGTLTTPPPMPSSVDRLPARNEANRLSGHPANRVRHGLARVLVGESAAETTDFGVGGQRRRLGAANDRHGDKERDDGEDDLEHLAAAASAR